MFVRHRRLVLQLPHQHADEVGVLDHDGHLLKHVLEPDVGLLQAVEGRGEGRRKGLD